MPLKELVPKTKKKTAGENRALLVAAEDEDKRLDQFLAENTDLSRTFCQKLIKAKKVAVGEKIVTKPAFLLSPNEEIHFRVPEAKPLAIVSEKRLLDIVYEDDDVVVVNKPPNMVVHPDETHSTGTLVNALLGYLGTENLSGIGGVKRPGIVHRLDKDTSGVIIVAKNDKAHRFLAQEIAERRTKKVYKTLVFGKVKHDTFSIDSPIARDPTDRQKMSVSNIKAARPALSHITLEKTFPEPLCSFLTVQIVTGRTHQIRVHLASVGFPLVGDPLYGNEALNKKFFKDFPLQRIFLHAESLEIKLPNGKLKNFTANLSQDLERVLKALAY